MTRNQRRQAANFAARAILYATAVIAIIPLGTKAACTEGFN